VALSKVISTIPAPIITAFGTLDKGTSFRIYDYSLAFITVFQFSLLGILGEPALHGLHAPKSIVGRIITSITYLGAASTGCLRILIIMMEHSVASSFGTHLNIGFLLIYSSDDQFLISLHEFRFQGSLNELVPQTFLASWSGTFDLWQADFMDLRIDVLFTTLLVNHVIALKKLKSLLFLFVTDYTIEERLSFSVLVLVGSLFIGGTLLDNDLETLHDENSITKNY
jgi:hypothetical protein